MNRWWIVCSLAVCGCADPPVARRAPAVGTEVVAPRTPTDWAALISFPRPPVAVPPLLEVEVAVPAPPTVFAASEHQASDRSVEIVHRDLASFCKEQVGCFEMKLPVRFTPRPPYGAVHAVRVRTERYAYSTLIAEVPGGVVPLQVSYDVEDPDDPGCRTMRTVAIERLGVENGILVLVTLAEKIAYMPEHDASREVLLPVVSIAKADGDRVHLRYFHAWNDGADLGRIERPPGRSVPWHTLAWRHRRPFSIEPQGTLKLSGS